MAGDDIEGSGDELSRLADLLTSSEDFDAALQQVAELARVVVPRSHGAAVVIRELTRARTVATTDEQSRALAVYQYREDEGPGVEALRYGEPRRVDDVGSELRWPGFCREAERLGMRSTLAVPLRMARDTAGAVTLYSRQAGAFGGVAHDVALLFASQTAIALSNADLFYAGRRLVDNLQAALVSRAVIEQAKGVIMAQRGCSEPEAFAALRRESQHNHEKLHDVASRIVDAASQAG